ncbi:M48 family metalloprotease [Aureispira sp. CCB-QB1]|uniref:M48 family metalloprotease n=1 Tax=Aureispira sp. CCB-QB1 TaxID=1313421 RepID=UPI0006989282|nr:M48 family metalloprotease [Aureispira sp. CCB-QB1]
MNFFFTRNFYFATIAFFIVLLTISCEKEAVEAKHIITSEDDANIGRAIDRALLTHIDTSSDLSLLNQQSHPAIYNYIYQISQSINGSSGFLTVGANQSNALSPSATPTVRVIHKAGYTGAFVVPGGYIYLYKDFLKNINYEAQFAPVLAHLMACSKNRYDIEKLEARFSTNFLLDLALGGKINAGSGADICSILDVLENEPYQTSIVELLDDEAEKAICELGYDVQTYSDWFIHNRNSNLNWYQLFPRTQSSNDYASHLFNDVKDSLSCSGEVDEGGYPQFKSLLN